MPIYVPHKKLLQSNEWSIGRGTDNVRLHKLIHRISLKILDLYIGKL